ncbi:hypothetical protein [Ruminococcus sp.]
MKFMKKIMAAVVASAVAAVSVVGASLSAYAAALQPATGAPYTVYMAVSAGSEQQWNPGEMATTTDASIEKDGDYSCSVTFEQGSATIEYLSLDSNINVYSFVEEGGDPFKDGTAKIKINSIEIKHTDGSTGTIAMQESATSLRTSDDGKCLRYSILDNWGSGTHENNIDKDLSSAGGLGAGDTLVVNFNISGIEAGGGTATTDPASTTEAPQNTDPNGTTADPNKTTTAGETTTTAAGGNNSNNGGSSNGSNNSSNGGSSNSSNNSSSGGSSSSNSSKSGTNNAKTSQTGDFGIAAVALGAVATAALGVGAYTITRKKK